VYVSRSYCYAQPPPRWRLYLIQLEVPRAWLYTLNFGGQKVLSLVRFFSLLNRSVALVAARCFVSQVARLSVPLQNAIQETKIYPEKQSCVILHCSCHLYRSIYGVTRWWIKREKESEMRSADSRQLYHLVAATLVISSVLCSYRLRGFASTVLIALVKTTPYISLQLPQYFSFAPLA
jgi:hypothetical protein